MERDKLHKKILWITQTGILLALLIVLQALTKGFGQVVTGSCVNCVLAVAALTGGLWCGMVIALASPVLAFLLNIAPQAVTVPAIMAGNCVFVVLLYFVAGKSSKHIWRQIMAWLAAAAAKFAVLYALVVWIICGLASASLLASGALKPPMLNMLPVMFSWPQLVTALIGGGIGLLLTPLLRKALKK